MPAIGTKNHRLSVLSYAGKDKRNNILIDVRCDCGSENVVKATAFRSGAVKSCGCYRREMQNNAVVKHHEPGEAGFAALLGQIKKSAEDRDYDYSLSDAGVRELTKLPCHWCGQLPSMVKYSSGNSNAARKKFGAYYYNGLDRYDNGKGYIPGNVVPCCDDCNTMKNDQSVKEFISRVKAIAARVAEDA